MNFQAHMAGRFTGQVSDQNGNPMPPITQQNRSSISGGHPNAPDAGSLRQHMQQKIYDYLSKCIHGESQTKLLDIVRRVDEGLFRTSKSMDVYLNPETLESRLRLLWNKLSENNNLEYRQHSSSVAVTMPTPGVAQSANSSLTATPSMDRALVSASGCEWMESSTLNAGTFPMNPSRPPVGIHKGSCGSLDGQLPNGHQCQLMQGDGYESMAVDSSRSGSLCNPTNLAISMEHQNMNTLNMKTMDKRSPPFFSSQPNPRRNQQAANNEASLDQTEEGGFQAQHPIRHRILPPQQCNRHPQQQLLQHQRHQQMTGQDVYDSRAEPSQPREQPLHQPSFASGTQNGLVGGRSEAVMQGQWHPSSHDADDGKQAIFSSKINVQEGSCQKMTSHNQDSGVEYRSDNCRSLMDQRRWLLLIMHATKCRRRPGECKSKHCVSAQKLLSHMRRCKVVQCPYPRCFQLKSLVDHYTKCRSNSSCPVCIPVKHYALMGRKEDTHMDSGSGFSGFVNNSSDYPGGAVGRSTSKTSQSSVDTSEDLGPSLKRIKIEQPVPLLAAEGQNNVTSLPVGDASDDPKPSTEQVKIEKTVQSRAVEIHNPVIPVLGDDAGLQREDHHPGGACLPVSSQGNSVKIKTSIDLSCNEVNKDHLEDTCFRRPDSDLIISCDPTILHKESFSNEKEKAMQDSSMRPAENSVGTKREKPKIKGVSMIELFTPGQVREHIKGLRQWVGQSKAKSGKNQAMEHSMNVNSCQLCGVERLTFEPLPIYCTPCGTRIKRNAMFYAIGASEARHCFCIPCYNDARGDKIVVDRKDFPKASMQKKKNDEETEESWVQCDKCEAWQHQICALFNDRRDEGGQAEYTCPNCYNDELERGERKPLPHSAILGAKDLPRTNLSDHIENRLFKRLKQEREVRARLQAKTYDEVPGAEALVVRVVSSVDRKLEVKQRFLEIFQEEKYPTEFGYKSKALLLFQKIEGVEVCLFGMYIQEFGSECEQPNQRRVYLSYLDSVKYFRPDIKAATGEALRTFVYHEILIGYLEYCKLRGFTSCYIWACPPLKGEDYILYCHPEIQKTPKADKLREWYLSMLRKGAKENIVVGLTNLYDHFFVSPGECKAKVTAARLPYFDGDYWPGAAEDILHQLHQEENDRKLNKGSTRKIFTKRALKASGQTDLSGKASKDFLLMHRLGETIYPMKEDFIMVHLQHACSHCCNLMVSGNRWVCRNCNNFQLCDKCYDVEETLVERERHPVNQREKHRLHKHEINDVAENTKDRDEIIESEFFDTRQAFLSLCQGNHYQHETLRRAKHSAMMLLYHVHNPTAPAFVSTCNICHIDIEVGQGWRCETCADYDVCISCYEKDGGASHPHILTNHPSMSVRDAQNKQARQMRILQLRNMLILLGHASQCRSPVCQYPDCRKVKALFRHGINCKTRAGNGCIPCQKMWQLLQIHARSCKDSGCLVPRCSDLKEHVKRLQQQAESRRRAAVNEMMRQQTAEVAGNAG